MSGPMGVAGTVRNVVEDEVGGLFGPSGTTVAGRYRLSVVVGTGGMGRVWRAHDELLDRQVAVKEIVLPGGMTVDERRAAQLLTVREARSAARLDHPNVVRVFDVVWTPGRSWIVMEYVPSRSLHEIVAQDGPLSHREAARVGQVLLGALRAAHAAGVLHHDIKPQNVLIAQDKRVVLTDFGLATIGAAAESSTPEPLLGSPRYIAPERARHGTSSASTDLWSLGATLYAAVEGRPPFDRASTQESLGALLSEDPDRPQRPGPLHPVIAGLLARDPAERSSAEEAQAGLAEVLRRAVGVVAVPPPRRPPDDLIRFAPATAAVLRRPRSPKPAATRPRSGKRLLPIAVVTALGIGAVVAGTAVGRSRDAPPAGAPASAPPAVSACSGVARPLVETPVQAAVPVPGGWMGHADPYGFALAVPRGWTRAADRSRVCFADPAGLRTFAVTSGRAGTGDPLREWQLAERTTAGTLPGYRRVSMGVLLVAGGGADWEYTWEPAAGTRLHTHRILLAAGSKRPYRLSWTTREQDWESSRATGRTFVNGFQDPTAPASPWAVPSP
ncbi:MAG: serine/threonine-protein kinase [Actinoplanes sp.]